MILFTVIFKILHVNVSISVDGDTSASPLATICCLSILFHEFLEWHTSGNFDAFDIFASISPWVWSIIINICENSEWAQGASWPVMSVIWNVTIFDGGDFFLDAKLDFIFWTAISTDFITVNSNSINDWSRVEYDCWWFWMFGTIQSFLRLKMSTLFIKKTLKTLF